MDPLSALREFVIRNEIDKISRVDGEFYCFGDEYTFPCSALTSYRSKQGNFFTLETLIYFIQNAHIKHPDYIKAARSLGIPRVSFIDRKDLLDYLSAGKVSSSYISTPLPQQEQQNSKKSSSSNKMLHASRSL